MKASTTHAGAISPGENFLSTANTTHVAAGFYLARSFLRIGLAASPANRDASTELA